MLNTTETTQLNPTTQLIIEILAIICLVLTVLFLIWIIYKCLKQEDLEKEYLTNLNDKEKLATIMEYKANTKITWFKKKNKKNTVKEIKEIE